MVMALSFLLLPFFVVYSRIATQVVHSAHSPSDRCINCVASHQLCSLPLWFLSLFELPAQPYVPLPHWLESPGKGFHEDCGPLS